MKIWVTRQTTGSLHSGGLERCDVWFHKPVYLFNKTRLQDLRDMPFGDSTGMEGLERWGWRADHGSHKYYTGSISFGKLFGYDEEGHPGHVKGLAKYVWEKLQEHYGNTEFVQGWYEYEKAGKCKQEDFLLEIDLDIKFNEKSSNGTTYIQWIDEHYGEIMGESRRILGNTSIGVRLVNALKAYNDYDSDHRYIEDLTKQKFMCFRNVGKSSWDLFCKIKNI